MKTISIAICAALLCGCVMAAGCLGPADQHKDFPAIPTWWDR